MPKILLVEDDAELSDQIKTLMEFEHHQVECVHDGQEAWNCLKISQYDLVILDWMLPTKDGLEVLQDFRKRGGKTPVLMLTGKGSVSQKAEGLDSGADDYLPKPFAAVELSARVRALLRRPGELSQAVLTIGELTLDPDKHQFLKGGQIIELMPKEFALLEFLMRHPNKVFTPEALLDRVWRSDSVATVDAIRSAMKRLRKKIDPDGEILRTIHGVGYSLNIR